jgi:putative FmdB family regulatory protein
MPIYEYKCSKCEHEFEQLVKSMDHKEAITCPGCGSRKVEKRLSVFAAQGGSPAAAPPGPTGCQGCGQAGGSCPFRE